MTTAGSAGPPSPPSGDVTPATPRLSVERIDEGALTALVFRGVIDEQFGGQALAADLGGGTLLLEMSHVERISSFGIREWVDFMTAAGERFATIFYVAIAPKVVDQFNMVANFGGRGKIVSFYAPYRCEYCDDERRRLVDLLRDGEAVRAASPPPATCPSCGNPEELAEDPSSFFSFVAQQPPLALTADVAAFLGARLGHGAASGARKLRTDKIVEGRTTYLRLTGDLDASFPREKIAEGLEGDVVFDLGGIGRIEPAGATAWRQLLREIGPTTDRLLLRSCPPGFLERLGGPDERGKAEVLSFTMPYACSRCATTRTRPIDVAQHYEALRRRAPPALTCPDCGAPASCAASPGLLARAALLPRPSVPEALRARLDALAQPVPAARPASASPTPPRASDATPTSPTARVPLHEPAPARGGVGRRGWIFATFALALALAAMGGGLLAWRLRAGGLGAAGEGRIVEASEGRPPAWIHQDFTREGDRFEFTGTSGLLPSRDEAMYEASAAAVEHAVWQLGALVRDTSWIDTVLGRANGPRARALAELDQATQEGDLARIAAARRKVADARLRVARLLRLTSGGLAPAENSGFYWEKLETAGGVRYRAFARYALPRPAFDKLAERYTTVHEALGIRAVTLFPGLGWRSAELGEVRGGAVILQVADRSPLAPAGFGPGDIILEVDDRAIRDGERFAQALEGEYRAGCAKGGRLVVRLLHGEQVVEDYALRLPPGCGGAVGKAEHHAAERRGPGPKPARSGRAANIWDEIVSDNPDE